MVHFCEDGTKLKIPRSKNTLWDYPTFTSDKAFNVTYFLNWKGKQKINYQTCYKNICVSELCTFLKRKGKQKRPNMLQKYFCCSVLCTFQVINRFLQLLAIFTLSWHKKRLRENPCTSFYIVDPTCIAKQKRDFQSWKKETNCSKLATIT